MNVLGIETSCDETSAAVVRDGRDVLSSVIFSQIAMHAPYGGVVPEIASRNHVEYLPSVIDDAVSEAGLTWNDIDAVAATSGPGLSSSLLVGFSAAKALALRLNKTLIAINHLEAHIYSVFLDIDSPVIDDICPFTALIVSGGHTNLVRVRSIGDYELLGQTIDDAAGEAFDKGAKLLGLAYPGGPVIDKISRDANRKFADFPRGGPKKEKGLICGLDPELCFSFSGLKTSLLYYLKNNPITDADEQTLNSVAASYQESIVDSLVKRSEKVMKGSSYFAACGGVSLNSRLRDRLKQSADNVGVELLLAEPRFCGDNAAMIAGLAGYGGGVTGEAAMNLDVDPNAVIA